MIEHYDILTNQDYSEIYFSPLMPPSRDSEYIYAIDINEVLLNKWEGKCKLICISSGQYRMPKYNDFMDKVLVKLMQNALKKRFDYRSKLESMRLAFIKIYQDKSIKNYHSLSAYLKECDI